jgi:MFS superfamily sulfate permease-like transporter
MSGAKSRWAVALQGVFVLVALLFMQTSLAIIPVSVYAGLLLGSGFQLLDWKQIKAAFDRGRVNGSDPLLFAGTLVATVGWSLTTGLAVGLALACFRLASKFAATGGVSLERTEHHDELAMIHLRGALTFVCVPKLSDTARSLSDSMIVILETSELSYIDDACVSFIKDFAANLEKGGGKLVFDEIELINKATQRMQFGAEVMREIRNLDRRKTTRGGNVGRRKLDQLLVKAQSENSALPLPTDLPFTKTS